MTILSNYRVLDLTNEKGMLCSKLLADMGAEVVRVQKPGIPVSQFYANTGKRNLSLNIESSKGRELLKQLVKDFDILVESNSPGYLDSLGLSYHMLISINKSLIMASISDFGQTGPYRDYKSSDLVASALGGQMYISGEPGNQPLKPFGLQAYQTASLFAAAGILLALWKRHTSKKGQHLDISIHESVAGTLDHVLVRYFYERVVAERLGSLSWNGAFRPFPCQDGDILLSLHYQWETLIEWLDSEGMAEDLRDKKWLDQSERQKNIQHIIEVLEKWTRKHTVNEPVELGQLMHFPWARVASITDVVTNPQFISRGFLVEKPDLNSNQKYLFPGAPVKMSLSPWRVESKISEAGEFNSEIYSKRLGLTVAEIESLTTDGVI